MSEILRTKEDKEHLANREMHPPVSIFRSMVLGNEPRVTKSPIFNFPLVLLDGLGILAMPNIFYLSPPRSTHCPSPSCFGP